VSEIGRPDQGAKNGYSWRSASRIGWMDIQSKIMVALTQNFEQFLSCSFFVELNHIRQN
jgi:hypothetical protein